MTNPTCFRVSKPQRKTGEQGKDGKHCGRGVVFRTGSKEKDRPQRRSRGSLDISRRVRAQERATQIWSGRGRIELARNRPGRNCRRIERHAVVDGGRLGMGRGGGGGDVGVVGVGTGSQETPLNRLIPPTARTSQRKSLQKAVDEQMRRNNSPSSPVSCISVCIFSRLPSRTGIAHHVRRPRRNGSALEAGEVRASRAVVEVVSETNPAVAVGGPAEVAGDICSRRFGSTAQGALTAQTPTQLRLADTHRRRVRVAAVAGAGRREPRRPLWRRPRRRQQRRHPVACCAGRRHARHRRYDGGP